MITNRKKIMIGSLASAAVFSTGFWAQSAFAQGTDSSPTSSLVSELATKFGLKEADVQAVFDQHQQEEQTARQTEETNRLNQAVQDGKLTSAQRDLIVAKQTEIKQKLESIKALTSETERRTALDQLRTDLKTWAQQNNIDQQWLHFLGGSRGPGMPRDGMNSPGTSS